MELIDTHCHLTFEQLAANVPDVLARSRAAGVTSWITVGVDTDHNRKVVELANNFENMYAAVGIHPHFAKSTGDDDLTTLKKLAQNEKVVAIGETGLDFHYDFSPPADQKKLFIEQLKIAAKLNKPVIVHCREAFDETMEILEQFASEIPRLVFHCFGGSAKQAQLVIEKGFYISFTGVITFKNADSARQAAEIVPLERLMLETDSPYMSPKPMRKQKINEPALMIHTAMKLAEIKQMRLADLAHELAATSKNFFGLF